MKNLREGPGAALDGFVAALNRGELAEAAGALARDCCFVTPDATVIRGRESVRAALGQLVLIEIQVELELRSGLQLDDVALISDSWITAFRGERAGSLRQVRRGTTLLRRLEGNWKILLAAPWGWAEGDLGLTPRTVTLPLNDRDLSG